MSEWKKVKIGDFLTEREGRYKPNDKEISKYQRLDKIDFSGNIHISDKHFLFIKEKNLFVLQFIILLILLMIKKLI